MATGDIVATQHTIDEIFGLSGPNFFFEIPRYQRPYAWTKKQAGELLDDLLEFSSGKSDIIALPAYFMGSIVLIEEEKSIMAVVDGQQRLVTLTILIAVLRSLLPSPTTDDLTSYLYEEANIIKQTKNKYKLKLRKQDVNFFQKYIQEEGGIAKIKALDPATLTLDSQKNIYDNADLFLERLSSLHADQLLRLTSAIVLRCFLVVVTTSDIDSAYRIFSILNGRGLDISLTDILKSDVLGGVSSDDEEKYADKWEDAEKQLGRDKFEALFSHIRMIYRKIKLRNILAEIRAYVLSTVTPEQFVDDILLPYGEAFNTILYPRQDSQANPISMLLKWLNRIDNSDWLPPAIFYLARNTNNAAALLHFFTDLERLSVCLMVLRINVNGRIERYSRVLAAIESNEDLYAADAPLQLTANEKSSIYDKLNSDIYHMPEIRQYVLLRLDELLAGTYAIFQHDIITVEHVLPQNPSLNSIWLSWFPDLEIREKYVHRLGNLVLLSRRMNSQAQNHDFDKKKDTYFKTKNGVSPFALTTQVLGYTTWTPDIISQRQQDLMQKLKSLWNL
jgi:uncharacterized protein DUF262/uncharacterized protein DUF1524